MTGKEFKRLVNIKIPDDAEVSSSIKEDEVGKTDLVVTVIAVVTNIPEFCKKTKGDQS
jgi:hypothetical protein